MSYWYYQVLLIDKDQGLREEERGVASSITRFFPVCEIQTGYRNQVCTSTQILFTQVIEISKQNFEKLLQED